MIAPLPVIERNWREAAESVNDAWKLWMTSTGNDRAAARDLYKAALNHEQSAAFTLSEAHRPC